MPETTSGRSVHRSSSPEKSPYVVDSPAYVESPRLWYIVGSLSQDGVLPPPLTGLYGKESASVLAMPAASSKGRPSRSR